MAESRWPQQALPDMSEKSEGSLKSGSPRAPPLPRDALGEPSAALRVSSAREGGPVGETGRWGQHLGRPPHRLSAAPARQPRRLEPDPRPAARLADDKSELEGSTLSVLSAASSASRRLPPQEQLREKAFEYCQRLIEQSNRRESPGAVPAPARSRLGRWPEAGAPQLLFPRGIFVFRPEPLGAQHWTEAVPGLWGAVSPSVSPFSCPPWGQLPAVPPPHPQWLACRPLPELPEHSGLSRPAVLMLAQRQVTPFLPPGALRKGDADLQKAVSAGRAGGAGGRPGARLLPLSVASAPAVPGGGRAGAGRALQAGPLLPVPHPLLPEGPADAAVRGPHPRAGAAAPRPVLPEPR